MQEKTGGNPFFVIQFVLALVEDRLITFDRKHATWNWDLAHIKAKDFTGNVADFMVAKLNRLSNTTQEILKLFACLGHEVEIASLAIVVDEPETAIDTYLQEAVRLGLILRVDQHYTFLHDRVQEAAYSLTPTDQRAALHLRVGRCLVATMREEKLAEQIFDVVNQFNRGIAGISDQHDRELAADLNLHAARKAKASAAYASAVNYCNSGMAVLGPSLWERRYDLAFGLMLECAECSLLSSRFEETERLLTELLLNAASTVEQAAAYRLKIELHVVRSENSRAVESALECLRLFGIDMPAHPSRAEVQAEYEKIWHVLGDRPIESLIDLPKTTSPEAHAAMRVLAALIPPSFYTDTNLFDLQVCQMVSLTLKHGLTDAATHGFGWFGWILGHAFHRYDDSHRFGTLALDLIEKHGFLDPARVHYAMGLIVSWMKPLAISIDYFRTAFRLGVETGDLFFATYSACQVVRRLMLTGIALDEVWQEFEEFVEFATQIGFRDGADLIISEQRFIAALRGQTTSLSTYSDAAFDELAFERALTSDRMAMMVGWYWILKIEARFLSGDYGQALEAIERAKRLLWATPGEIQLLDYHFYSALTLAAQVATIPRAPRAAWRARIAEHREQLRAWAQNNPGNFESASILVEAEIARIENRILDAERLYEEAISVAHASTFIQNEGLANELAARFYAARGFETIAQAYLRNARACYLRWGAKGKVRQLEQLHPKLLEDPSPGLRPATLGPSLEQLDIGAVMKASQAVSGEMLLDRLIETLMTLALEHAGAERGLLILVRGSPPQLAAEARTEHKTVEVIRGQGAVTPDVMPETLLRTVLRTQENVLLNDATALNPFSADAYFWPKRVRSVLCLPLLKQTELIGLLYLENNLVSHVFTPARIAILGLLASQAAISLENARLYSDLLQENRERQMAEDAMRASEARWRNLFENVPVGVALVGADGRYVEVNPALCSMTGYSAAELRRLSPADITHEDDRAATQAILAARITNMFYAPRIEKRYRRRDGGIVWVELSTFIVPVMGSDSLHAGVAVDITERKRAETALRRSEAYLAEAQRLSRTGSFGWNVASGNIFWSEESFDIFGYYKAPSANIQMVLQRVHPEDLAFVQRIIEQACSLEENFDFEHRLLMPDQSIRYVHAVGRAVRDQAGELEFMGSVMDITAAKRAEENLNKAQADLAHVARVTTLGELAASIAHEINQPLAAIATSGNACLRWLGRDPPELDAARSAVTRIVQAAHRAGDVIHSVRTLTLKSGPQLTKLDLNDAIQEVLALTRGDLHRHGVVLHTEFSAQPRRVLGDRVQLQQVLLNLITNAMDAMANVTDRPKTLMITAQPAQPDGVLVSVEDTGAGFDPAASDQIFAPFYTTKSTGMGIGLSICKTIIEAHGGQLWAKPNVPQGAIFRFRLPADGREAAPSA